MNADGTAAFTAAPLIALVSEEHFHSLFTDIPYVLKRRVAEWVLGCIAVFLFHYICAGEIRTLVAETVSILPAFPAQDDAAAIGAEFRLVLVRTVAARAGLVLAQRAGANAAVQAARSNHISCKHAFFPPLPGFCQHTEFFTEFVSRRHRSFLFNLCYRGSS